MGRFEFSAPRMNESKDGRDVESLMDGGIFAKIGFGEVEQGGGGLEAVFLQMDKCAGKLDEALVEMVVAGPFALCEPEFLENVVGFVEKPAIEAIEIAEVIGREIATGE